MTSTDQQPRSAPATLKDLVGEPKDFFDDIWNVFPYQYRVENLPGLLSPGELWDEFACSLIVRPWVSLTYPRGLAVAEQNAAFNTRVVVNNDLVGYPDPDAFRSAYESGASITLDRPELWNPRIASLVGNLGAGFRGDVWSTLVLAPPQASTAGLDTTPTADHSAEHAFVLQLAGRCTWSAGERQAPGSFTADLDAGGLLYLPPGCERSVRIGEDGALLLVISVAETSAERLAEIMGALFLRSAAARAIEGCHHEMTRGEKIAWLRDALSRHLAKQDPQEALKIALRSR
ncbi:hypothetical protein [Nonomuraea sp. KM88]|uniref:hypothetical protein n=1 Tax=Nonomuraea sp. KM88 TaxID=3457427 RepID=UPI003FCD3C34